MQTIGPARVYKQLGIAVHADGILTNCPMGAFPHGYRIYAAFPVQKAPRDLTALARSCRRTPTKSQQRSHEAAPRNAAAPPGRCLSMAIAHISADHAPEPRHCSC